MNIAIITARKGSKRLKNKNIRLLKNKPLYYWAIKILKKSGIFKKIVVTTDHPKIIKNAKKFGADLVLIRKKNLADDKSTTIEVVKDTIIQLKNLNLKFTYVCCMYPTSPLTSPKDIKKSFTILKKNKEKFIFPVYPVKNNFELSKKNKYDKFNKINNVIKKKNYINKVYIDAGQYYFSTKENWLKKNQIIDKNNIILIKKNTELRDINTLKDLNYVREIFRKNYEIL